MRLVHKTKQAQRLLSSLDPFWTISLMTLIIAVRYMQGAWYYNVIYPFLLALACIFPQIIKKDFFWLVVTVACFSPLVGNWYYLSAHIYLLAYWVLAILLSCLADDPLAMLANSARWLVGGVFFFAALWKVMSPDFVSGNTMHLFLLTTSPLGKTLSLLTGLSHTSLEHNIALVEKIVQSSNDASSSLLTTESVGLAAIFLTRATQITETSIALLFLIPLRGIWTILREIGLIAFFLTAYIILPVAPFAVLLACLGYALSRSPFSRAFFVIAFFAYQLSDLFLKDIWAK